MKIISWNLNGLRAVAKAGLFISIQELDADILCVQETKTQEGVLQKMLSTLSSYNILANSAEKKGTAEQRY